MYTKGLPLKLRLELIMAEKQGLLNGLTCPDCGRGNNVNFRDCKIRGNDGIRYYCNHCEWYDVIGLDIVEDAANEYIDEHPWSFIGFIYLML